MFNLMTLRALKGAPLSIVMAMMMVEQPVGEGWLVSVTGYSQNTVRKGCKFLEETRMIRRDGRYEGYVLADEVRQTAISLNDAERQNLTLDVSYTTTTFNKNETKISEGGAGEAGYRASKNDSRLEMLYEAGVMEPTASRLLAYAWVTVEYLEAHIAKAQREGTAIPLLIHRIRSHDPKPKMECDSLEAYRLSWLGASQGV